MQHDTAGDPMVGLKWTHRTTARIAAQLQELGIQVSDRTVARLLKQMDFSLRVCRPACATATV
jgi:transposase